MRSFRRGQRIIVFFLGIIAALACLELALRLTGLIHMMRSGTGRFQRPDSYKILCLGDSFTYGIGAPETKDYPAQLQKLLRERMGGFSIEVINRGAGASNTRMILDQLKNNLQAQARPDLVVLLAGSANFWNTKGCGAYRREGNIFSLALDGLGNLKVCKLTKMFFSEMTKKIDSGKLPDGRYPLTQGELKYQALEPYRDRYRRFMREGRYESALEEAKKAIAVFANDSSFLMAGAAYFRMQLWSDAALCYRKAIEFNPGNTSYYGFFAQCYDAHSGIDTKPAVEFLSKYKAAYPDAAFLIQRLQNNRKFFRDTGQWIERDIRMMIAICRERGIKVVLLDYPDRDGLGYNYVNGILKKIAAGSGLPFLDLEAEFNGLLQGGARAQDFFAPDGHCNASGYKFMARKIGDKLFDSGLVVKNPADSGRVR